MITNGMFTSTSDAWSTPQNFFDQLNTEFSFTLDPCCTDSNAKCSKHYTTQDDGLTKSWSGHSVFMNPPYGKEIGHWMKKAWDESLNPNTLVVCLIPARTDTAWWHMYAMRGAVRFIRGRLRFGGSKNSAPFPSAIVVFGGKK